MSKTWKWILGILLVLVLIGVMFGIGYMWQSHRAIGWAMPFDRDGNGPMHRQWNQQIPGQWDRPMMGRSSFIPFGGFSLLGGLVKLVLFLGLLYGAYWLGRRNARIALDPKPAAQLKASTAQVVEASPEPVVEPAPAPRKRVKKV
jgi:hypothetical protein